MLKHRLLLGPVFIALIVFGLALDQALAGAALPAFLRPLFLGRSDIPPGSILFLGMLALSIFASRELATILANNGIAASKRITTAAAILGLVVSSVVPPDLTADRGVAVVSSASVAILLAALLFYSRHKTVEGIVAAAGGTLLAFVYLGLMFGFLLAIRRTESAWMLLWILLTTKSSDIGAYFTGRAIGRHKLIPWLSPGKTWEGFFGGIALSAVVGGAGFALAGPALFAGEPFSPLFGALCGVVFAVVGQAGDLIESGFKRDAGIKDSARYVPGFGGVLDLIDSVLLVAPVAYWLLLLGHRLHPS